MGDQLRAGAGALGVVEIAVLIRLQTHGEFVEVPRPGGRR